MLQPAAVAVSAVLAATLAQTIVVLAAPAAPFATLAQMPVPVEAAATAAPKAAAPTVVVCLSFAAVLQKGVYKNTSLLYSIRSLEPNY